MTKKLIKFSKKQWLIFAAALVLILALSATTVFAAGDVASAIEGTWNTAKSQIKTVVNNVVFPVVDMVLAILFFVKVGTAYFDYKKHGQFEFTAPAILFDGFEFTTNFDDCDNVSDFFIKPYSAKIISIEAPEFSKEELCVEDIEINDNCDGVSCQFKTCFDVDKKLGTNINDDCDSWVNFYAEYFPENRELNCEYYVHTPNNIESHSYIPTDEERRLIIFAMEEYCQDNYGENIMEFIQSESEEIGLSM